MKTIKMFLAAVVAMASGLAMADYLYWLVSDAKFDGLSGADANFAYATVRAGTGDDVAEKISSDVSGYYTMYTVDENGQSSATDQYQFYSNESNPNSTDGGAAFFGSFDSTVGSFLFELWTENGSLVGYASRTRADILSFISSDSILGGSHPASYSPFELTSVVPEPTSGLLLLLGMAGLALRRRKIA